MDGWITGIPAALHCHFLKLSVCGVIGGGTQTDGRKNGWMDQQRDECATGLSKGVQYLFFIVDSCLVVC